MNSNLSVAEYEHVVDVRASTSGCEGSCGVVVVDVAPAATVVKLVRLLPVVCRPWWMVLRRRVAVAASVVRDRRENTGNRIEESEVF